MRKRKQFIEGQMKFIINTTIAYVCKHHNNKFKWAFSA